MDVAGMVLDYLKVLIWPATTLAVVYGFRGQFGDLIHRVRMLSGPGIDAEFSERVLEASEGAEVAVLSHPPGDTPEGPESPGHRVSVDQDARPEANADESERGVIRGHFRFSPDETDALMLLADSHPDAAVVAAFTEVERELRRLGETELPVETRRYLTTRRLAESLPFPQDIKHSLVEMSKLRNSAAHGQQVVSTRAARAFIRSSRELMEWLNAFRDQPSLF
ncbi:hypothetical protein ABZ649_11985 [Streptomyces albidoflavus]|uniref:hypothetical protein n=1 Tax=Streptomyces albidoflavus TaxID=1886 RepID=UPI0033F5EA6B